MENKLTHENNLGFIPMVMDYKLVIIFQEWDLGGIIDKYFYANISC